MADDKGSGGPPRRPWSFSKLRLNHPPPKSAAPPFPPLEPTPSPAPAPGGTVAPLARPTPDPLPTPTPEPLAPGTTAAFNRAAPHPPEVVERLDRGAELRRKLHADRLERARDRLAEEQQKQVDTLGKRLDRTGVTPIVRIAEEADLASRQRGQAGELEASMAVLTVALEDGIRQAYDAGRFSDHLESMLAHEFGRAAGHEAAQGHDEGSRAQGD